MLRQLARRAALPLALCASVWLAACASTPSKVRVVNDNATDVSAWQTYAWQPANGDAPLGILESRVRAAVTEGLVARGYVVASADPDFKVAMRAETREHVAKQGPNVGVGVGGGTGGIGGGISIGLPTGGSEPKGTLALDVIDGHSNAAVWSGSIDTAEQPQDLSDAALRNAVNRIIAEFPTHARAGG
jgi:Domain of unknown function (DUF4136)